MEKFLASAWAWLVERARREPAILSAFLLAAVNYYLIPLLPVELQDKAGALADLVIAGVVIRRFVYSPATVAKIREEAAAPPSLPGQRLP